MQRRADTTGDKSLSEPARGHEDIRRSQHDQSREAEPGREQHRRTLTKALAKIADGHFRGHSHGEARLFQVDAGNGDLHPDLLLDGALYVHDPLRHIGMRRGDSGTGRECSESKAEASPSN